MRFLNTVGGGRVVRITADTAWVEDADGFEIPTPLKDCVVVEAGDTFIPEIRPPKIIQEKLRQGRTEPAAPAPGEVRRPAAPDPRPARPLRAGEDELTVQLAFLPQDRAKLGLTNYEAYLVNYSGFTLYYVYLSAVGTGYKVRSTGTVEPHGDAFLEEFAPADLNDLEQLAIQILPFHDAGITKLQTPLSVRLKLDVTKFFKLHSFRPNDYFTDDALMLPIVERGAEQAQPEVDVAALASAPRRDEPLVVDLHASEILETTAGMSSADIHDYQRDYFHRTMQEHIRERGRKIVFIHGKGDGVLRASIERELRRKYPTCRFQDASFQEYGYGATQVTIG